MNMVTNSFADLINQIVLIPNDIEWSDIDGIEMREDNYAKPTFETIEFLNKWILTEQEIEHHLNHQSIPSRLENLIIWSQNFIFVTIQDHWDPPEFIFRKILRNPAFEY